MIVDLEVSLDSPIDSLKSAAMEETMTEMDI